ncbi:OmpA family protein [Maribacter algarum]|nr:OmpA family protein [Maribacter algarum]
MILVLSLIVVSQNKCYSWLGCSAPIVQMDAKVFNTDSRITSKNLELSFQLQQNSSKNLTLSIATNWGDGSPIDSTSSHTYTEGNIYDLSVDVGMFNKWGVKYADTIIKKRIEVCIPAKIVLSELQGRNSIPIGKEFKLIARVDGEEPKQVKWYGENEEEIYSKKSNELVYVLNEEGDRTFYFKSFFGDENSECNLQNAFTINAYRNTEKPTALFEMSADAASIPKKKTYQSWFYFLALAVFSTSFFVIHFYREREEEKRAKHINDKRFDELVNSFSLANKGTIDIPFHKKNFLPVVENKIRDVAKSMRKRINDNIVFLDIKKTVHSAVHNFGFFKPIYGSRTQQSEFLVLINQKEANSQQTELFEFLIELLQKQGVYIDKYYFKESPLYCCQEAKKISLEHLNSKYPEHILLIYGDAHQLIYPDYPVIKKDLLRTINKWEHRAIISPISFNDWGFKEKEVLLKELPVFPLDIEGQLLVMNNLFIENLNILTILSQFKSGFYEHVMVNFEDLENLLKYCEKESWANINNENRFSNVLFQWIAALAVYPKINWNLTLSIGKRIMDEYDLAKKLNFTSLLKLSRISWLEKGEFPDFMRLSLLKHLTVENEVLARETILELLDEIGEAELNETHYAFEEKETQRIISQFTLYAYDSNKYNHYKDVESLFGTLRENSQMTDMVARAYLENPNLNWKTPINHDDTSLTGIKNISLQSYFKEDSVKKRRSFKDYFWTTLFSAFLMCSMLFAGAVFLGNSFLNVTNMESEWEALIWQENPKMKEVEIHLEQNVDSITRKLSLQIDKEVEVLRPIGKVLGDSSRIENKSTFTIPVYTDDKEKSIKLFWNDIVIMDSSIVINCNSYDITLNKALPKPIQKIDSDDDGIVDIEDDCKNEKGPLENYGCPWPDQDKDGTPDKDDKCVDVPGTIDNGGCPQSNFILLNDFKIGFYFYEEQRYLAEEFMDYMEGTDFKGQIQLYPKDDDFFKAYNYPSGFEIRYEVKTEFEVSKELKKLLEGYNSSKYKFTRYTVGTNTPGFISVFIPYYTENGDFDKDGVLDKNDKCPKIRGPVSNGGCPYSADDWDGDGIPNDEDRCPEERGTKINNGCFKPISIVQSEDDSLKVTKVRGFDDDLDGVVNNDDDCPNEAGPSENNGCPWPDKDGDSVLDKDDKCPDVAGTLANNGCPTVTVEVLKQLNDYAKTILFDTGKSSIKAESTGVMVDIIKILGEYSTARFSVEGHTDSQGNSKENYVLSEKRANAVRDYLIDQGIDENRLIAVGHGDSEPIATNNTRAGRKKNRRIEINLIK